MQEWAFAQLKPSDNLAELRFYSMKKPCGAGEIDFRITVWEYAKPREPEAKFFAQADKQINQNTAPFTPCGWGSTLLDALGECIKQVHQFPYEGPDAP
jgi:hypothetical protein